MRRHPAHTAEVLAHVAPAPDRRHLGVRPRALDGRGYPCGLDAAVLAITARILAVADVYDALAHDRPDHAAMLSGRALQIPLPTRAPCLIQEHRRAARTPAIRARSSRPQPPDSGRQNLPGGADVGSSCRSPRWPGSLLSSPIEDASASTTRTVSRVVRKRCSPPPMTRRRARRPAAVRRRLGVHAAGRARHLMALSRCRGRQRDGRRQLRPCDADLSWTRCFRCSASATDRAERPGVDLRGGGRLLHGADGGRPRRIDSRGCPPRPPGGGRPAGRAHIREAPLSRCAPGM